MLTDRESDSLQKQTSAPERGGTIGRIFDMHIEQIKIENFRLLQNCSLDMREKTTLLVGKNNTGKTSFAVLLEKFLERPDSFTYTDFPIPIRQKIISIDDDTNVEDLAIRLVLRIAYDETDNLAILSEFMLDLDPTRRHTNILFECCIDKKKLLRVLPGDPKERRKFIENTLSGKLLNFKVYAFDDFGHTEETPYYLAHRDQLEEKERSEVRALLNFQVIHARRNVASSEDAGRGAKPLSAISTRFFKKHDIEANDDDETTGSNGESIEKLRSMLAGIDDQLGEQYAQVFRGFLKSSRDFLELGDLKVVSNIQSQSLIETSSQVIYGETDNFLPEHHSGLGYLNILYLLLQIELCRDDFARRNAPLNLLLIEEPEAHTHPQMQYVFAEKIHGLISQIPNLQALLTTHSSHIVSKSNFEDIRYLSRLSPAEPVTIKNFHTDLSAKYEELGADGAALFQFLKQYLTINSAELFFASKAIFIEGTTERILLPLFIEMHDRENDGETTESGLSSQNISVLEVGANARAFAPFLEFIGVRTLVITDIDTTKAVVSEKLGKNSYPACPVAESTHTSNETLKHFLSAPDPKEEKDFSDWHKRLVDGDASLGEGQIELAYQLAEDGYHARSFEDAFISINLDKVKARKDTLAGLKNRDTLEEFSGNDFYSLTAQILGKKSDFAGSVLYVALVEGESWRVPKYIMDGLKWIHKN
ncbi:ATP-dependent nuclease [Roseovarius dicentrarchi]|uniref:ATP-dependent nuclease n=1 Tax=Roseovarius dicentrarchi TaxID=2250573 RepID=UPI00193A0505|nr:ATP-dependent endonuclease [Roseovarius dicentrarchi]